MNCTPIFRSDHRQLTQSLSPLAMGWLHGPSTVGKRREKYSVSSLEDSLEKIPVLTQRTKEGAEERMRVKGKLDGARLAAYFTAPLDFLFGSGMVHTQARGFQCGFVSLIAVDLGLALNAVFSWQTKRLHGVSIALALLWLPREMVRTLSLGITVFWCALGARLGARIGRTWHDQGRAHNAALLENPSSRKVEESVMKDLPDVLKPYLGLIPKVVFDRPSAEEWQQKIEAAEAELFRGYTKHERDWLDRSIEKATYRYQRPSTPEEIAKRRAHLLRKPRRIVPQKREIKKDPVTSSVDSFMRVKS